MELLNEKDNLHFLVDNEFDIRYLSPIQSFVQWKMDNNLWDDYNELYHACRLVEQLKTQKEVWMDTHLLVKKERIIGVVLIVGGKIQALEKKYTIEKEAQSLLLKYFHIVEKGQGYGSLWLKSVIIPHYQEKKYERIYLNSSHPDSFPFYKRLGKLIATYEQPSDNHLYQRTGNCFLIDL